MSDSPDTTARDQWVEKVTHLLDQLQQWAREKDWHVIRRSSPRHESRLGNYEVPELEIHIGPRRLYVEPVARDLIGADGRVDILLNP